MEWKDTTVIIPTLNERDNIKKLLSFLLSLYPEIKIIVTDDGSEDGTQDIVREIGKKNANIQLLDRSNEKTHGLTVSVLDGIENVRTEYFIVMDGDLQHPPEKVGDLIQKLREGKDIVVGVRECVAVEWLWYRKLMSKIAMKLGILFLRLRGKKSCKDVLSGFFGARTSFLIPLIHSSSNSFVLEGYKILYDILKILPEDTEIGEVGYTFGTRKGGKSKIGLKQIFSFCFSLLK